MIDIIGVGSDLSIYNTQTERAKNILSVQLGSLEYAQDLGIDLNYFLSEEIRLQDDSFKSYCIQTLANRGINISSVIEVVDRLSKQYTFNLTPEETSTGLIAR